MVLIPLPAGAEFDRNVWLPQRTVQVNRSAYTRARQTMLIGGDSWIVSASIMPVATENEVRAWRAFIARLQNELNTFRMPAACTQHNAPDQAVSAADAGSRQITLAATPGITSGMFVTVPLQGGAKQLAQIIAVSGSTLTLDRALRRPTEAGALAATRNPYGEVALTAPPTPDDENGIFSWSFEAQEAF